MTAEVGSMASSVIYQEVKAWIAQQEAFEAQYHKPAPLTDVQRMALGVLRLPTATPSLSPPPPPPPTSAADGGLNYVGILMEYHQKRKQLDGLHWVEEESGSLPGGVTGRVCRVTIVDSFDGESGHIEHFPAMDYGLNDDGTEPRFTSKKDAKRFAAKCAVEWLVAQGLISSSHFQTASSAPITLKRTIQSTHSTTPSPPSKRQSGTSTPGQEGASLTAASTNLRSPRATELVAAKCQELKLPIPRYNLVEIEPNIYQGRAQLDDYGDVELLSLANASFVESMVGKDATKNAVAAKVLEKLRDIDMARDEQLQSLMAHLNNDV
ncbi:hypothetical protein N0V82_004256 [Gnomoniopsis sp. IMI 355080]|nr:hypothetical protein N0V82_004256 [Gnomoniopsis sp. IMI 355080]